MIQNLVSISILINFVSLIIVLFAFWNQIQDFRRTEGKTELKLFLLGLVLSYLVTISLPLAFHMCALLTCPLIVFSDWIPLLNALNHLAASVYLYCIFSGHYKFKKIV